MGYGEYDEQREVRQRLTEWLSGDTFTWSFFCTLTFRRPPFTRQIQRVGVLLALDSWPCERRRAFVAEERGSETERRHLHCLLEAPAVDPRRIWRTWFDRYGRAKVERYNPQLGAAHYLTKYVLKDACDKGDWDVLSYVAD